MSPLVNPKELLKSLNPSSTESNTHLLAHSMGNVVAAEALRLYKQEVGQSASFPLVKTYVAMQGAISAGAYGDDEADAHVLPPEIPAPDTWDTDLFRYWSSGVLDTNDPDPAYMALTFDKAEKWVNIFNEDDPATAVAWRYNNAVENLVGSLNWPYGYQEDTLLDPVGDNEYLRLVGLLGLEKIPLVDGLLDSNGDPGRHAYEILAFLGQANAMPIGTKEVDWFNANTDLRSLVGLLLGEENENSSMFAGSRKNHSFQFHHDAMTTWPFWLHIKEETEFDGTY